MVHQNPPLITFASNVSLSCGLCSERKPVHSRSHMRKFRYATEMQFKPVRAEKHSNRMLWWLFVYVHLQAYKQRWHLEFKTFRVIWLLGYPSMYVCMYVCTCISWFLDASSWVWNYSDLYFQVFCKITKGIFIYFTTCLLIVPNWQ